MELVDSDAKDSSDQSQRPMCFRPSRSRERRFRKTSLSSTNPRHIFKYTPPTNQEEARKMYEIYTRSSETLHESKTTTKEATTRRKYSPVLIFSLDKIESLEQADEATSQRVRKPSKSILIRESSGHKRRMSNDTPGTSHGIKSEKTDEDLESDSSTISLPREKSYISEIISQILTPTKKGQFDNFKKWLYNRQDKTFCGRTCNSWFKIVVYSIFYLIFQMTFTLFLLYISLLVINNTEQWPDIDKSELQTYAENGIGLSAFPASEGSLPLIWYKSKNPRDYKVYVDAINFLFKSRIQNTTELKSLGPCSQAPYGYGEAPCIIVRVNKQLGWSADALLPNSTLTSTAPPDVKKWVQTKRMLWLHCAGYNQYDREHINKIVYYPDPPGINPNMFPLHMDNDSPIIGIQLLGFTMGMSIGIQCKLWYDTGTSAVEFVIYVEDFASGRRALGKVR